ncbi:ABC transporter ATP-binding protein [Solemya pervernicosa gill symbiont]|uniref:ABC transporter ATP-binding protein n=2 Tax=Gammaproteobacteria incertae sedis TaxID=118884 RepID=A0A1T2L0P4_9GAMM|nr:ATP-binding cassette domain-containing protein [Candidatus Reidiella endopervernicosa]OOZ38648.1 ABC transporter ATP-binding protein [Solemya pervernicosa gill symbiont]QKQ26013.1 ATP-binding cassette domain-containing protein [Candidatus Reidiella endopervernicosa]
MNSDIEKIIKIRALQTRFGDHTLHHHIDLDIHRGEILAIAGGSGCGKSTLLREMLNLHQPYSGTIELLGYNIHRIDEATQLELYRNIGVMYQHGALFGGMSVLDNIAMPLREHTRLSEQLIEEIATIKLGLVGLPIDTGGKRPSDLSGGMLKRVAVARALALDPQILFLDEPTAGLDPQSAAGLDELIGNLKRLLGLTIIVVTHDLDTLWQIVDRVALLGEGRVIATDTMEALAKREEPTIRDYFHGPRGRAAKEQAWTTR